MFSQEITLYVLEKFQRDKFIIKDHGTS